MNGNIRIGLLAASVLLVSACADPPDPEIQSARSALAEAEAVEAAEYAPESLGQAEAALQALEAELMAQEDKFAMFRDYEESARLAAEAQAAADRAAADAEAGKQRMRLEVAALVDEARAVIAEATTMLQSAPRGKGSEVDLAVLQADITGASAVLAEVEQSLAAGRLMEAKSRAESALAAARDVKAAVLAAVSMTQAA